MATATKNVKTTDQQQTQDQQPTPITQEQAVAAAQERIARIQAERKRLAEELKLARAAVPQEDKLAKVVAREQQQPAKWVPVQMANAVKRRVAAGQDRDEALAAVLAFYTDLTRQALGQQPAQAD